MSVPAHDEWDAIQERLRLADQVAMQLMQDDKMMVKEWGVGGEYPEAEVVPRAGVLQGKVLGVRWGGGVWVCGLVVGGVYGLFGCTYCGCTAPHTHTHIHTHMYTHTCTHTHAHTHMHAPTYTHPRTHTHMYTRTFPHISTPTPAPATTTGWYESYPEWVDSATGTHHRFFFTYSMQQRIVNMTEHGMKRVKQLLGMFCAWYWEDIGTCMCVEHVCVKHVYVQNMYV